MMYPSTVDEVLENVDKILEYGWGDIVAPYAQAYIHWMQNKDLDDVGKDDLKEAFKILAWYEEK